MQVFKAQRNIYIKNEIISLGLWFAVIAVFIVLNSSFSILSQSTLISMIVFLLFLISMDAIKQYRVKQINIDQTNKSIKIILKSKLSGNKDFTYSLNSVSSDFKSETHKISLFKSGTLFIYLLDKKCFKISNRYGFSSESLEGIHTILKKKDVSRLP